MDDSAPTRGLPLRHLLSPSQPLVAPASSRFCGCLVACDQPWKRTPRDLSRRFRPPLVRPASRGKSWSSASGFFMPGFSCRTTTTFSSRHPGVGLSRGMKWLNQEYAQSFNVRHRRVGHLFQGRFKGILVERESHLLELVRSIVLNPVRCPTKRKRCDWPGMMSGATTVRRPGSKLRPPGWRRAGDGLDAGSVSSPRSCSGP